MVDRNTIMSWLEGLAEPDWRMFHSDSEVQTIAKETLAMLKEQGKSGCDGCIYKGSNDCQLDQTRDGNVVCPNGKLNIT